jgi:Helix-turn-helix domain
MEREMPKILYQKDLSEMLRRPLQTLRYWRHIGYGPRSFKLGGRVVYKLEDVEAWIETQYNNEPA